MADQRSTGIADVCGADVAAFALGALERAEVEGFERHLHGCVVCRDELASFQQVVDVLGAAASRRAVPRRLRRRVVSEVSRAARAQRRRRRWESLGIARRAAIVALAAMLLAVAIGVGIRELGTASSPPTRVYAARVTGSVGSAEVRVREGQADLVVRGIAAPPGGRIYQVWLVRGRRPHPTRALFGVTAAGDADVDVPGNLRGVRKVLVTTEPAGGSAAPTHAPVITAVLG